MKAVALLAALSSLGWPAVERGRYVERGELARARAAFEARDWAAARAWAAKAGDEGPARYLRALAAYRAGDWRAASVGFDELERLWPAMADRARVHGAVSREELGDFAGAARRFARVSSGSALYADARLGLARALERMGEWRKAFDALKPLASLPPPAEGRDVGAEALLARADLARAANEFELERAALRELWSTHPLSPLAALAARRLGDVPDEVRVLRAERLLQAHRNAEAIDELAANLSALVPPDALACRAHLVRGRAFKKERRHLEAIAALEPLVDLCADPAVRISALFTLASSRSIAMPETGPGLYDRIVRELPSHPDADAALFFAADLALKAGQVDGARQRLEALVQRYAKGEYAGEAHFRLFWFRRSAGDLSGALVELDRISAWASSVGGRSADLRRALYWRARVLEQQGRRDGALAMLARLAAEHPATYEGAMARQRLRRLAPQLLPAVAAPRGGPVPATLEALSRDARVQAGLELLRLGFGEAAAAELRRVDASATPQQMAVLLAEAGDLTAAHLLVRVHLRHELDRRPEQLSRFVWELAYPPAHRALIERHCGSVGVPTELLQALIREESAFDPHAYSWAGAVGLTQLLPSRARVHDAAVTAEALTVPEVSIRLGCAELGRLLGELKEPALAFAAYNADLERVRRWLAMRAGFELDELIEQIPIAETRGYVKRLIRSVEAYRLLYPPEDGSGGSRPAYGRQIR